MRDRCTYYLRLRGQVNRGDMNALSPVDMIVEQVEMEDTLVSLFTDQSGLLGLLSYLHGLGFIFLSVTRVDQ